VACLYGGRNEDHRVGGRKGAGRYFGMSEASEGVRGREETGTSVATRT